jgi:hypothetical protein
MAILASMLWRRIDTPGHDACRLEQNGVGWRVEGAAVFRHPAGPACVAYSVQCDQQWRTVSGRVRGALGQRAIDYRVALRGTTWTLNETPVSGLEALVDLDLGFTPATNLQQLRRVLIGQDEALQLPVAWLDVEVGALTELPQLYTRRGEAAFWYEAPSVGYQGLLELAPNGFIRSYPNLWEAEQSD